MSGRRERVVSAGFRVHMKVPPLFRWVVWLSCLGALLLSGRMARAAAPMCDERGASVAAPGVREIYAALFHVPLQPVGYSSAGSGGQN